MGTFFLCLVGNGAVHESALTGGSALQTCFAFGMSVTFGVYISCSGSGGHINPAVSMVEGFEVFLAKLSEQPNYSQKCTFELD